ncbi:hypothetical protein HMPREF1981_00599 [Bacteroides pyogenes F0041]|uniref:Uncharacterized protein n=1 Tax=Bacteroides pyogenes F0041 TaxID=1321819 RepID=U2CUJ7_9BACE|nr:hypothetical protein HMPREF1981_00599 [Bacteroides pyogenes F0041]
MGIKIFFYKQPKRGIMAISYRSLHMGSQLADILWQILAVGFLVNTRK